MQARVFSFFAGGSGIWNSNQHVWQWKEEAMLCEIHMQHDFKSHRPTRFLSLLHYASQGAFGDGVCRLLIILTAFQSFCSVSLKQQQNLMKVMFSCVHFPIWPYPPKNNDLFYFSFIPVLTELCITMQVQ